MAVGPLKRDDVRTLAPPVVLAVGLVTPVEVVVVLVAVLPAVVSLGVTLDCLRVRF